MEISQIDLFLLFLYSVATGAVLGVIYDAIRVTRALFLSENERYLKIELPIIKKAAYPKSAKKLSRVAADIFIAAGDFVFMLTAAVAIILVAYVRNMGRMRWLIPTGVAVGFVLYYYTIGKLILKISGFLAFLIRAGLVYIATFVAMPIKWSANKIKNRMKKPKENKKRRKRWHVGKKADAKIKIPPKRARSS